MSALLEVRDLSIQYASAEGPPVCAVNGVTFDVREGETVGLLGESGCGKTTVLLAIPGLLPEAARIVSGSIRFAGQELLVLDREDLRRVRGARLAIVFQDPTLALNPVLRVGVQVGEVLRAHRAQSARERREQVLEMLREVGFREPARIAAAYPHELSGGQRQRIAIAQALACRPSLLIADEPTGSLDSSTEAELRALLERLRAEFGLARLVASHDPRSLATVAGRVLVMYAGLLVEEGPAHDVFARPLHPYMRALARAFPRPARHRLEAIAGAPPDPARLPAGCVFEPRCPDRAAVCAERRPRESAPAPSRRVRCVLHGG